MNTHCVFCDQDEPQNARNKLQPATSATPATCSCLGRQEPKVRNSGDIPFENQSGESTQKDENS